MGKLSALAASDRKILAYGPSGSGKTTLLGHLIRLTCGPSGEGAYIMNFDPEYNLAPLKRMGLLGVDYQQFGKGTYDQLLTKTVEFHKTPPKLLAVENGGRFYDMIIHQISAGAGRPEIPAIQDYKLAQDRTISRLEDLIKVKCPLYVSFHEQVEKDEAVTGRILGRLLITGRQIPDLIPPMFNTFLHFSPKASAGGTSKPAFRVFSCSDGMFHASDKFDQLLPVEENFENITKRLLGMDVPTPKEVLKT